MNPKTILTLLLGAATGGALGVGATVSAQVGRPDIREPFQPGVVDGVCVFVEKSLVDAGQGGQVQRSRFDGAKVEARASLTSLVPEEDASKCGSTFQLSGPGLTEFRNWYLARVEPTLKTACRMP